jgi:hypothetical protein
MGAFQAVNYGTRPAGALLGGLLGSTLGLRPALCVAAAGGSLRRAAPAALAGAGLPHAGVGLTLAEQRDMRSRPGAFGMRCFQS